MAWKTALVALVAAVLASAAWPARIVLADDVRTPGVRNPAVTRANIDSTICVAGWTKTIRPPVSYTNPLKIRQMREYGLHGKLGSYEEDHLISLALGGHPTSPRNLWPEPQPRARIVDVLERRLHDAVCEGRTSLRAAQRVIARVKHSEG